MMMMIRWCQWYYCFCWCRWWWWWCHVTSSIGGQALLFHKSKGILHGTLYSDGPTLLLLHCYIRLHCNALCYIHETLYHNSNYTLTDTSLCVTLCYIVYMEHYTQINQLYSPTFTLLHCVTLCYTVIHWTLHTVLHCIMLYDSVWHFVTFCMYTMYTLYSDSPTLLVCYFYAETKGILHGIHFRAKPSSTWERE